MRLKDGKIKRRGVKEEVQQFMIVKGEEDASEKERAEYEVEYVVRKLRVRSLKIIESLKSSVGTTSSRPKFLVSCAT